MTTDKYEEPLVSRYTSKEMQYNFSADKKFQTWRKWWTALAEAEMELGIEVIKPGMIEELIAAQKTIDYDVVRAKEKEIRHDVMAHIYEYGTRCPTAAGIIHLGATSQYVCCGTDLVVIRDGLDIIRAGIVNAIDNIADIAKRNKGLVTLGYTHYQPAQPTTIGKRFTLYIQDLLSDLESIESLDIRARGAKGTTGTQASYLELFKGDYKKVKALDKLVSEKMGFDSVFPVTGQTYPRKLDTKVAEALAGIGVSLNKMAVDIRLLSHQKCVDEPFDPEQVGSSAMAYKRNPMRSERLCSIARKLTGLVPNFYNTAMSQWFERTLDDSAIRRMDIPQAFLCADAILMLANNITDQNPDKGRPMIFYPKRISRLLNEELPFMATEAILIDLVQKGHSRQEMHELIKDHSVAAGIAIKEKGSDNDLFTRLAEEDRFPMDADQLKTYLDNPGRFAGCAEQQTEEYLREVVMPVLMERKDLIGKSSSKINV